MHYESFTPAESLKSLVKEYWVYENESVEIEKQKIIPDGYSEIIIHYGNPYQINLSGKWEAQSSLLFSSQISKYFFLENTGKSGMIGVKLHPVAFYELFQQDVSQFTNQVVDLEGIIEDKPLTLKEIRKEGLSITQRKELAEKWLEHQLPHLEPQTNIRNCIDRIFESHGLIDIDDLADGIELSTRQLERQFKKVVGLTPKFYCRIIRFNYIFEVVKNQQDSWIRTALQSGFFDQSHFIKNFKEFTGEEPSKYGFDEINLANFFLQK